MNVTVLTAKFYWVLKHLKFTFNSNVESTVQFARTAVKFILFHPAIIHFTVNIKTTLKQESHCYLKQTNCFDARL